MKIILALTFLNVILLVIYSIQEIKIQILMTEFYEIIVEKTKENKENE